MTEPVFVLGGWQSDFAERAGDGGLYGLLEAATLGALEEAGLTPADVEVSAEERQLLQEAGLYD